jgi:hypothetical protein
MRIGSLLRKLKISSPNELKGGQEVQHVERAVKQRGLNL